MESCEKLSLSFSVFSFWGSEIMVRVYLPWEELISQTQLDQVSALHLRAICAGNSYEGSIGGREAGGAR